MKVTLTFLIVIAICFQGTESFFGINVVYPIANRMSSECIKASSTVQNIPSKITQILKVTVKFNSDEFETVTESLTDLQHFFNGLLSFLQQYAQFINEPPAASPLRVLSLLVYNAQLMESATQQILSAPKNFAGVFGSNLESVMELIVTKYSEQITNIRLSLETLQVNFESILEGEGGEITVESLDAEIDIQAITDTLTAFQEIQVVSKQMILILTGLTSITQTLDSANTAIIKNSETTRSTMSLLTFTLNIEIQSAKATFNDQIRSNIQNIAQSFGNYSQTSLIVFANTTSPDFLSFLQEQQTELDEAGAKMGELLVRIQGEVSKRLQDYYSALYQSIESSQTTLANNVQELSNYLALLIIQNSGSSFKNCFTTNSEVQQQALELIKQTQTEFTRCVTVERTVSTKVQSLMTFIVEDVTLNIQGAADRLCGCSVRGGKKVQEQTMDCISKITENISSNFIAEDEEYLNGELDTIDQMLQTSQTRFTECTGNITVKYETAYEQFQQAAMACLVSSRSL